MAVIEHGTRRIRILEATGHPVQSWVLQPHRTLNQAAPFRPLPDAVTNLDRFRVLRRDHAGGAIHEYRLVA